MYPNSISILEKRDKFTHRNIYFQKEEGWQEQRGENKVEELVENGGKRLKGMKEDKVLKEQSRAQWVPSHHW